MGIKFGPIDAVQIAVNEARINYLELLLLWLLKNNAGFIKLPSDDDIKNFKDKAAQMINEKYPGIGFKFNS